MTTRTKAFLLLAACVTAGSFGGCIARRTEVIEERPRVIHERTVEVERPAERTEKVIIERRD